MNWWKATGLFVGTVILSGVLALQAFTNVFANDQPAVAASAFPLNGVALERAALNRLRNEENGSLTPLAEQVLAKEPLSPVAWTILALAQQDEAKKDAILLAASKINRRTLLLQSNLLLLYASRDDFSHSIGVLNQILTVYPEQEEIMFPVLMQALKDERSVPEFILALDKKPSWSDSFLEAASKDSDTLANLTRVRMGLFDKVKVEQETDETIIGALIDAGRIEDATALYRRISESSVDGSFGVAGKFQRVDWDTRMPPFDWQLTDSSGARAQVVNDPERLEFFVRSGKAGVLAERLLAAPESFTLEIRHSVSPVDQLEDVRVELQCEKNKQMFFEQRFTPSPSKYSVGPIPADCAVVRLSLSARAWSDKADLSGNIYSVAIKPR